jgi:cytochrome b6-f complex iron-sulfur subunit
MDRRHFLGWTSVGMLISSFPLILAACNPNASETTTEPEVEVSLDKSIREDGFQAVGTTAELEREGRIRDRVIDVLIVSHPDNNDLIAVNPMCTHQGCGVNWDADSMLFNCPCHGSQFAVSGAVTSGPANQPLTTYETKTEDNLVLVKLA